MFVCVCLYVCSFHICAQCSSISIVSLDCIWCSLAHANIWEHLSLRIHTDTLNVMIPITLATFWCCCCSSFFYPFLFFQKWKFFFCLNSKFRCSLVGSMFLSLHLQSTSLIFTVRTRSHSLGLKKKMLKFIFITLTYTFYSNIYFMLMPALKIFRWFLLLIGF